MVWYEFVETNPTHCTVGAVQRGDLWLPCSAVEGKVNEGACPRVKRGEAKLSASAPSARAEKEHLELKCFPSLRKYLFLRHNNY